MARKLRLHYPGAIYQVTNRGDRREAIFSDDLDRQMFLNTLGKTSNLSPKEIDDFCAYVPSL